MIWTSRRRGTGTPCTACDPARAVLCAACEPSPSALCPCLVIPWQVAR
ncbi:hypothetical protein ABT294_02035 [Nonomuraea sp. NPDC000554]